MTFSDVNQKNQCRDSNRARISSGLLNPLELSFVEDSSQEAVFVGPLESCFL